MERRARRAESGGLPCAVARGKKKSLAGLLVSLAEQLGNVNDGMPSYNVDVKTIVTSPQQAFTQILESTAPGLAHSIADGIEHVGEGARPKRLRKRPNKARPDQISMLDGSGRALSDPGSKVAIS